MIKLENTVTPSPEQGKAVIMGARNPMNSWDKSDSGYEPLMSCDGMVFMFGKNDLDLMHRLKKAGTDHRKFMRMLVVYVDITAPLYWWKEFDTYKVGTVANSCSTMHKIQAKEFTVDDFSCEHLFDDTEGIDTKDWYYDTLLHVIDSLNTARESYLESKEKHYWWQMIQLLPSSYNQKRTVMLNYEVLANIYKSRKNHKLDEWHDFCDWIEQLPYSEIIT
jgi:hypothetical protein